MYKHTYTRALKDTTLILSHACTHTYKPTQTHTQKRIHTHTHTHIDTH